MDVIVDTHAAILVKSYKLKAKPPVEGYMLNVESSHLRTRLRWIKTFNLQLSTFNNKKQPSTQNK